MKLCPQAQNLLKHLKKHKSVTQRSALIDLNIMALPRRIADLRQAGHKITTTFHINKFTNQRYGRYEFVA